MIVHVDGESRSIGGDARVAVGTGLSRKSLLSSLPVHPHEGANATQPLWGPGRELFYLSLGGQLTAVPTETDDSFTFGNPEVVFEETYYFKGRPFVGRTYDISPDGKRFLMIKQGGPGDETEPTRLVLVLNWFEELNRLVPTDN